MVNVKNLGSNKIKIDEKLYKNIHFYYMGHVMIKNSRYVKIKSVSPLYIIIKIDVYIKESHGK